DHHGSQPHPRELPCGIERNRSGLEGDGGLRRQLVLPPQLPEALRRRRHVATRDDATVLRLDHEHTPLAVHVQSHVRFHRAPLLLEFGAHCDPVVGRGPYRGGGQPAFIDTISRILSTRPFEFPTPYVSYALADVIPPLSRAGF